MGWAGLVERLGREGKEAGAETYIRMLLSWKRRNSMWKHCVSIIIIEQLIRWELTEGEERSL